MFGVRCWSLVACYWFVVLGCEFRTGRYLRVTCSVQRVTGFFLLRCYCWVPRAACELRVACSVQRSPHPSQIMSKKNKLSKRNTYNQNNYRPEDRYYYYVDRNTNACTANIQNQNDFSCEVTSEAAANC